MDLFVSLDKMKELMHIILTCETWKVKIYPLVKPQLSKIKSPLRSYIPVSVCTP